MIKVGIIDSGEPPAGELIRMVINHPDTELVWVSRSELAGKRLRDVYANLWGATELEFVSSIPLEKVDIVFQTSRSEGAGRKLMDRDIPEKLKIVDMGRDFRPSTCEEGRFTYGLPEVNRRKTCASNLVSNPGEIAQAVALSVLPLARGLLLNGNITAFVMCGEDGPLREAHSEAETETEFSIRKLQNSFNSKLEIVAMTGGDNHDIFATVVVGCSMNIDEIVDLYEKYYEEDSFVFISDCPLSVEDTEDTNKCLIFLEKISEDRLVITCSMDRLMKGSAGTAIHNMNLMFNLEETVGLGLV